jgi:hypothetical protein
MSAHVLRQFDELNQVVRVDQRRDLATSPGSA